MSDKARTYTAWAFPILFLAVLVVWQLVPGSHEILLWIGGIALFVGIIGTFIDIDNQNTIAADQAYERRKLEEEERARLEAQAVALEMEEREVRMAAYKAVAELAERGIDVRLPSEERGDV